jgi:glycosyltransferase involved in cell wall biosynthesis
MRILVCNYEYPPLGGGGGVVTAHLVRELAARHEVTVLTSGALGLPPDTVEARGIRVVRLPVPFRTQAAVATLPSMLAYVVAGVRRGRALTAATAFDVVNTHFVLPTGPVGDAVARGAGIPNVLSLHGGDLFDPSKRMSPHRHPALRVWIRRLLRRADVVVAQSTNTLQNMRRLYAPERSAVRIPLGIPRPPLDGGTGDRGRAPGDEVRLVTVGRLVARKAVHQLIAMMTAFRGTPVRLLVVGGGPEEGRLRVETGRRGLDGQVRFLGQVGEAEKFGILATADAYVSTSQHEGFGLVFLEAMACGLPVVAYDHGGQTDFLDDGETGFLVPLNDLARFTERCRRLAADPRLRRALGENGRRRAEELYIDRCAATYETVFRQAVAAHAPGPRLTAA